MLPSPANATNNGLAISQNGQSLLPPAGASAALPPSPSAVAPAAATGGNSSGESETDPQVKNASTFLQDRRVKNSSAEQKIAFLKGKGLSKNQIVRAFTNIGETMTPERVASVRAAAPAASAPPPAAAAAAAPRATPMLGTTPQVTGGLFPAVPVPPPKTYEPDWRDAVIGVGAAVLAGIGAVKLVNAFSPFEFRRKGTERRTPVARSPRPATFGTVAPPPLPPPPAGAPPITAAAAESEAARQKLESDLAEAKAALEAGRTRSTEMAVNNAQLRSQVNTLSRQVQRLEDQKEALEKELEELKNPSKPADEETEPVTVEAPTFGDLAPTTEGLSQATDAAGDATPPPGPTETAGTDPLADVTAAPAVPPSETVTAPVAAGAGLESMARMDFSQPPPQESPSPSAPAEEGTDKAATNPATAPTVSAETEGENGKDATPSAAAATEGKTE